MINELMRRRALLGCGALPYDAEVEFLESSGTQYIDLGMPVQYTDEMYIDLQATGNGGAYGAYQSSPFSYANITVSNVVNLGARYYTGSFYVASTRAELTNDSSKLYYRKKGVATYNSQNIVNTNTMNVNFYLFAFNNNGSPSYGGARLFSFSVKRNGSFILDMIPVRVGQVGYMYDKVSGVLFGNKGTGSFILGNDINT